MRVTSLLIAAVTLSWGGLAAAQAGESATSLVVTGRVTSAGHPVHGALISVAGDSIRAAADSLGRFRLVVSRRPALTVAVRAIGYSPRELTTPVGASVDSVGIIVELVPAPQPLPDLVVDDPGAPTRPRLAGFEERRRKGFGVFITEDVLVRSQALNTADLLRNIPGISLSFAGDGTRVHFARCGERVGVWIDGVRIRGDHNAALRAVHPRDIVGLEVYRGVAQLPAEFLDDNCAAIAIWTK